MNGHSFVSRRAIPSGGSWLMSMRSLLSSPATARFANANIFRPSFGEDGQKSGTFGRFVSLLRLTICRSAGLLNHARRHKARHRGINRRRKDAPVAGRLLIHARNKITKGASLQGIWPGEQHYLTRTAEVRRSNPLGSASLRK